MYGVADADKIIEKPIRKGIPTSSLIRAQGWLTIITQPSTVSNNLNG
jgi:hypothetical protein